MEDAVKSDKMSGNLTATTSAHSIANETWRRGILHLTVDGNGLVSLWDYESHIAGEVSYLKLELTGEQVEKIRETMMKGGATP